MSENKPNEEFSADQIETIIEMTYANMGLFVRDTEVSAEISAKYQPGLIIREKGLTYASYRVGGQTASHRFVIFSNHMHKKDPDPENFGLCFAGKGSVFKVIGRHDFEGGTWIILLHLLDGHYWKVFRNYDCPADEDMVKSCLDWLQVMGQNEPIRELTEKEWVESCQYPVGIDDKGAFFPL